MLFSRDLTQWSSIGWRVWQAQREIQDVRRYSIGMRHIADVHPSTYGFITVLIPIDSLMNGTESIKSGKTQYQYKCTKDGPLPPRESFYGLEKFACHCRSHYRRHF
jgi:hypothetical protein